ncbi:uncharacterized protein [Rutidosis leptorrhynchoides]|uniref:uncharacterized protein n=1 Tax=Rutidosis leptorrhynchoides TaxID=125765 RepID=UPI003A98E5BD
MVSWDPMTLLGSITKRVLTASRVPPRTAAVRFSSASVSKRAVTRRRSVRRNFFRALSLFFSQVNIDPTSTYDHLRSCPPRLGADRTRGVRGGNRVATPGGIRVGSWNIGTLTGKRIELVDTFLKSNVDIGCVQETRWKGEGAVDIKDYRLWYSGSRIARNGVGIFLGKLHKDNVVDVSRLSDRIMSVSLIIKEETFTVISAYAPHTGLSDAEKKSFWELLDEVVRGCPADHRLIIGGDLNGRIGVEAEGYEGTHGGFGFGPRNEEGRSILEFAIAHEMVVANSFFKKRDAQLATFHSGGRSTQIDFLLLRKGELRTCRDCKVLPALTCSSQHRLLVMDLVTRGRVGRRARVVQPRVLWKNLHGANAETFRATVADRLRVEGDYVAPTDVDQIWNRMASAIRDVAKETLGVAIGTSRAHKSSRESWWLNDDVQTKVALKQTRFRELITFGEGTPAERTRIEEIYKEAKREAKKAVAIAKDKAYEDLYRKLNSKEGANDIYRIAKARERRSRDLVNVKFIKNEAGQTIVKEDLIRNRWEEYFASLFCRERPERNGELHEVREYQNNCFCTRINQEEVRSSLRKMGRNKAVGPDQIPIEAWRCLGDEGKDRAMEERPRIKWPTD